MTGRADSACLLAVLLILSGAASGKNCPPHQLASADIYFTVADVQ